MLTSQLVGSQTSPKEANDIIAGTLPKGNANETSSQIRTEESALTTVLHNVVRIRHLARNSKGLLKQRPFEKNFSERWGLISNRVKM